MRLVAFDLGVGKKFIQNVEASMEPGSSAIFFIIKDGIPAMALAALKPYKAEVYQTNLEPYDKEHLKKILSKRQ